jgi:hypothetical protein
MEDHSMNRSHLLCVLCALAAPCASLANDNDNDDNRARARLSGFQEVPALSTPATGSFAAKISPTSFSFELSYRGLLAPVTQAHIHFAQKDVNGAISVFLCTNLSGGPAGTQACPSPSGTVTGTVTAASVIGPSGQGISPGEFDELVRAMRSGATYANVHSELFPGGEIRGQIKVDD